MQRETGSQLRRVRDPEALGDPSEWYAYLACDYALRAMGNRTLTVRLWRETDSLQDRPQNSLLKAISRLFFGWCRAPTPGRREEMAARIRTQKDLIRELLSREWLEVIGEDLGRHYRRELSAELYARYRAELSETQVEEERAEPGKTWPEYASEDFDNLTRNAKALKDSTGDPSRMLFHAAEMETLLGRIEEKARVTNRKYEARLAASLRDICRVHDSRGLSQEQAECLKGCVTALVEGWGKITREKLNFVRTRLLDKGLTWLPVTDKTAADIKGAGTPEPV